MTISETGWTYGAELEYADWPLDRPLPPGLTFNTRENTQINSTGIANDPHTKNRTYNFGGEVNTAPTDNFIDQLGLVSDFLTTNPEARILHRAAFQPHIRIPGLRDDLNALKRLAAFNYRWLPEALPLVDPLPVYGPEDFPDPEDLKAARHFSRRRKLDRQKQVSTRFHEAQMAAETVEEFFKAECPRDSKTGAIMWHAAPRAAVNVRQLIDTDTVEFRSFPGTCNLHEMSNAFLWAREWMACALFGNSIDVLLHWAQAEDVTFPVDVPFLPYAEHRFWATCHCQGGPGREAIMENIAKIEAGTFDRWPDAPRRLPL